MSSASAAAASDLRLVVFDMDGTLIDSQHLIVDAMHGAFARGGQPLPSREDILSIVGLSLEEAVVALAPHLPRAEARILAGHYRDGFVAQRAAGSAAGEAPLYPGARAASSGWRPRPISCSGSRPARRGGGSTTASRSMTSAAISPRSRPPTTTRPSRIPRCSRRRWPRRGFAPAGR